MKVVLRPATESDWEQIFKWRNDPEIMKGAYTQKNGHVLKWDEHVAWLKSRNKDYQIFIIQAGDEILQNVGVITVSQLDHWEPETACYIGEKNFWRMGIGKIATLQIHDMLRSKGYEYSRVTILDSNTRAIQHCLNMGFKRVGCARTGESLYRKKL